MRLTIFFPLAAFLSLTVAESSGDASPCLVRCPYLSTRCLRESAAVAGCISSIDYKCTCPSKAFKDTLGTCLQVSCSPDDLIVAGELHKERCGEEPPQ
ncbi:hypothetical protein N7516_010961 [Penicillium verrucosum]|uniref:uncharacterized protein n=1 Tax=Penicillium verrucosum TaxID=60171 RepID=UPI002545A95C|nr:uncharacterized protein N7516_010961 [Penicillium verrucosum]KAJ5920103.1 hypothetical protein N7516_010961 [Penicillium verrucosum]